MDYYAFEMMKTILFIPGGNQEEGDATFPAEFARHTDTNLLTTSNWPQQKRRNQSHILERLPYKHELLAGKDSQSLQDLYFLDEPGNSDELENDMASPRISDISEMIQQNHVMMIIKKMDSNDARSIIASQHLLNNIQIPLYLIPTASLKIPEKLAYITDLRYCRRDIVNNLLKITANLKVELSIVHICAAGLPEIEQVYARQLFDYLHQACRGSEFLSFQHINNQNVGIVADVLVHGMGYDGLVLANHHIHYQKLISEELLLKNAEMANCPLLLFPG